MSSFDSSHRTPGPTAMREAGGIQVVNPAKLQPPYADHDIVGHDRLLSLRPTPDQAPEGEALEFGAKVGALIGLGAAGEEGMEIGAEGGAELVAEEGINIFDEETAWDVIEEIPNDSAAVLLLIEHNWAVPLRDAVARAGGFKISEGFISPFDLIRVGLMGAADLEAHQALAEES